MASVYSDEEKADRASTFTDNHAARYVPTLSSLPNHVTASQSRQNHSIERTGSISIATGPAKINSKAKIVGEFRTLRYVFLSEQYCTTCANATSFSIHVTDTKEGNSQHKGKKDVNGEPLVSLYILVS